MKKKTKNNLYCLFSLCCLLSFQTMASSLYQVDVIGFLHKDTTDLDEQFTSPKFILLDKKAIALRYADSYTEQPYEILPKQQMGLKKEAYLLKKQGNYEILFHYSWLQTSAGSRVVRIPGVQKDGWRVEGSFRIRKPSYYVMDSTLYFSHDNSLEPAFLFKQQQRLKEDSLYYLDHPQAGLLVKIHQIDRTATPEAEA